MHAVARRERNAAFARVEGVACADLLNGFVAGDVVSGNTVSIYLYIFIYFTFNILYYTLIGYNYSFLIECFPNYAKNS